MKFEKAPTELPTDAEMAAALGMSLKQYRKFMARAEA